jgi:hypothetical protein
MKEREYIVVCFVFYDFENIPDGLVNRWNQPLVTWDNLQEFIDFTANLSVDYALANGATVKYDMSTWYYRKQRDFDIKAINENFVFDETAQCSHDYVSEFLEMARSSETPADYYYDHDICTAYLYDEEEDEWYDNEDNPCYCNECLEERQRFMDEYDRLHGERNFD